MTTEHPAHPGHPAEAADAPENEPLQPTVLTVEAVVRQQMAASLGGLRGILEGAVPGVVFTLAWLVDHDLRTALIASCVPAAIALVLRVVQRQTVKFVANALFGILIGYVLVRLVGGGHGHHSGSKDLVFFLPGLIISTVYSILMAVSCVVRWPLIGFMIGSVSGDPTAWHDDPQVVRLCSRLTWLFLAPGAIMVALETPFYVLGRSGAMSVATAFGILAFLRVGVGWVVRIAAWASMVWLLARNATPIRQHPTES